MEIVSVENGVRRTMEETGGGEEDLDLDVDSLTTTVGRKKKERERKGRGRRGTRWKRRGRGGEMQAGNKRMESCSGTKFFSRPAFTLVN